MLKFLFAAKIGFSIMSQFLTAYCSYFELTLNKNSCTNILIMGYWRGNNRKVNSSHLPKYLITLVLQLGYIKYGYCFVMSRQ